MTLNCTLFSDLCQCHTLKYAIVHKVKTFLKDYKFRHRFLRVHLYSNWQLILFLFITTRNECFNSAFQVYNFLLILKNLASEKFLGELLSPKTSSLQTIWKTGTENSRWHKPSPICAPNTEVKEGVVCFAYWCIVLRALAWVEQGTGSFKEFMPTSPIFDRGLLFLESSIVTLVGHYCFIEDLFWGEMFQKRSQN